MSTPLIKYEPDSSVESEDGRVKGSVGILVRETGRNGTESKRKIKNMKNGFANQQLETILKVESDKCIN